MDKKRIEIRFDSEKDKDIIDFLENQTETMAGYIKNLIRNHVRTVQGQLTGVLAPVPTPTQPTKFEGIQEVMPQSDEEPKTKARRLPSGFHANVKSGKQVSEQLDSLEN